jgi:hypothetical protein
MKSFNMDHNKNRCGVISGNIVMLHKAMYGTVRTIKFAPSKYALKVFGGTLTIEEFRNPNTQVIVKMTDQIFKIQNVQLKQEIKYTSTSSTDEKFNEISQSIAVGDTLKLKRSKPLKRDDNNLEKSLGITRKK